MDQDDPKRSRMIEVRIKLLEEFGALARRWFEEDYSPEGAQELRRKINRLLMPAREAVAEAGAFKVLTISPPPMVGGLVAHNTDPFQNFFQDFWGVSPIPMVLDAVDQAIGVYTYGRDTGDHVSRDGRDALDLENAIERSLRPSFRSAPPGSEKDVQDAVENILNAVGVLFVRDKDVVVTGPRASRPDFTFEGLDLALEVKLAKEGHSASKIQEEINADITAYKQRWRRLLFVVYDLGIIDDPVRLVRENQRLFGVTVVVIKH